MEYFPFSFIFGILTVLSPCVLPLLPVILSGTTGKNDKKRALVIILSLGISTILVSVLFKSSLEIAKNSSNLSEELLNIISGILIIIAGIFFVFPEIWEFISLKLKLQNTSDQNLEKASKFGGTFGAALLGLSLGPVFNSCSPTYIFLTKTLIQDSFIIAFINIVLYTIGLMGILFVITIYGQKAIKKLKWAANPKGLFRRIVGLIMIIMGILIITGLIKNIETYLLEKSPINVTDLEIEVLEKIN